MAARESVVQAERGDQLEQLLGGLGRCLTDPPRARASATTLRSRNVVPVRIAILNLDGAWSGNASVRLKSAASGSRRRASRSNPIMTDVATSAMRNHRRIAIGTVETVGSSAERTHATAIDATNGTSSTNTLTERAAHGLPDH
jgi:hypothetical protein